MHSASIVRSHLTIDGFSTMPFFFNFLAPHCCFSKAGHIINPFVFLRSFTGADFSQEVFQPHPSAGCDVLLLPRNRNQWIVTVSILGFGSASLLEQSSMCSLEAGPAPAGSQAECCFPSQHRAGRMSCGVRQFCTCWRAGREALLPGSAIQAPCVGVVCAYARARQEMHTRVSSLHTSMHTCRHCIFLFLYMLTFTIYMYISQS